MYKRDLVTLLKKIFTWSTVDLYDVEDSRYLLSKRFSEVCRFSVFQDLSCIDSNSQMMSNIGSFIEEKPLIIPDDSDLHGLLDLFITILYSTSLTVSIPILHLWVKLLNSETIGGSETVSALIGPLLQLCSQRLIRYEALTDDSADPVISLLNEDIDTIPERHAFLGNNRRNCVQVVEIIVQRKPFEALHHILAQVDDLLSHLYDGAPQFEGLLVSGLMHVLADS